jgi:predicted transcriptional regulator
MGSMKTVMNIKFDPKMKKAIQELADKQLVTMTTVVRQAVDKHLKEHGINWREEEASEK